MKKIIIRLFSVIFAVLLTIVSAVVVSVGVVFLGPSNNAKVIATNTFTETSALKFVPGLFLEQAEIQAILDGDKEKINDYITLSSQKESVVEIVIPQELSDEVQEQINEDGVIIENVYGDTFVGVMAIVPDPSRLGLSACEFSDDGNGILVKNIAKQQNTLLAFNGGEFADDGGMGNGGMPLGAVVMNGTVVSNKSGNHSTFIGFDYNYKLMVANISGEEAVRQGAKFGVTFGPILIRDGDIVPQSASGFNPRTAIGQRQDGTVLILVVDGRQPNSLGATYQDLANVMLEYGAVTAGNLDGGTSSNLYYRDQRLNTMASAIGERYIPTVFTVSELS